MGMAVYIVVDGNCQVVEASPRPRFVLEQLLAQCDAAAEVSAENREWIEAQSVGGELR